MRDEEASVTEIVQCDDITLHIKLKSCIRIADNRQLSQEKGSYDRTTGVVFSILCLPHPPLFFVIFSLFHVPVLQIMATFPPQ